MRLSRPYYYIQYGPARREIVGNRHESKPPEFVDRTWTPVGINMLATDGHSRILASRLISLQIAFYILEIVLGMLLPVVIHNARNIRPGQQPTKASFNHRPQGTAATFPSLSGIRYLESEHYLSTERERAAHTTFAP